MKLRYLFFLPLVVLLACDEDFLFENVTPTNIVLENEVVFTDIIKAANGDIIENATVSVYAGNERFSGKTDKTGRYEIVVPVDLFPKSGFIALNIQHPAYQPILVSYKAPLISENIYRSNGISQSLRQCPNCIEIKEENASELFHLGDEIFGGTANSQFQKNTDGLELTFSFDNSPEFSKLKLSFEAKGLQSDLFEIPSSIRFGEGESINLPKSPNDGSYANYSFEIDNNDLYDTFVIKTVIDSTGNLTYDDWEFNALSLEGIKNN